MNVIANTNCSFCLIQLASKEKDNIKIYGKPVCNRKECIDKANAEAQTAAVSPRDRMVARLVRNGFVEQKTMRGFFILDGTTPIGADINNLSDVFPDMPQIGVLEKNGTILEEGHGIRRIDDIRRDIEGMLKSKPAPKATKSKDEKKPEKTEAGKAPQAGECKAKGTEVEGEVKKMEPKKEEKGLVTAYDSYDVAQEESSPVMKKPMTDAERDAQIELAKAKKFLEGRGSNYSVQGKERPDAHKIQQIANERGISIEIISAVQTDTY